MTSYSALVFIEHLNKPAQKQDVSFERSLEIFFDFQLELIQQADGPWNLGYDDLFMNYLDCMKALHVVLQPKVMKMKQADFKKALRSYAKKNKLSFELYTAEENGESFSVLHGVFLQDYMNLPIQREKESLSKEIADVPATEDRKRL